MLEHALQLGFESWNGPSGSRQAQPLLTLAVQLRTGVQRLVIEHQRLGLVQFIA